MTVWIDDLLGAEKDEDELIEHQIQIFKRGQREVGLKFNAKNGDLFVREIKWCGKIYSTSGVRHDPQRVESLRALQQPETLADLQQFIWSAYLVRKLDENQYTRLPASPATNARGARKAFYCSPVTSDATLCDAANE